VTWQLFDREAAGYEDWYATLRGRRASRAEMQLLDWLMVALPDARTVLEVGCGTGHFLPRLAAHGLRPIGLDRAPAMLTQLRRRAAGTPALLADAHALPIRDGGVDLVVFVTTLEFLEDPRRALAEAARVARRGLIAIALNRWSLGGLSRRVGPQSRGALLSRARDLSPPELRRLLGEAAAGRLVRLRSRSALLPAPLPSRPTSLAIGDVVGAAVRLRES
jgi:SAM-dependent methyltransferase